MSTYGALGANDEMRDELADLFADAAASRVTSEEFRNRLDSIHESHLGVDASSPQILAARTDALVAFNGLSDTIERHHQLEQLERALGLFPEQH